MGKGLMIRYRSGSPAALVAVTSAAAWISSASSHRDARLA
jgi:hypothetical protein